MPHLDYSRHDPVAGYSSYYYYYYYYPSCHKSLAFVVLVAPRSRHKLIVNYYYW